MAKRWSIGDAYVAAHSGTAAERTDIARRYPLFATSTLEEIVAHIPPHVSLRAVEAAMRGEASLEGDAEDQAAETLEATPAAVAPADDTDLDEDIRDLFDDE